MQSTCRQCGGQLLERRAFNRTHTRQR
jgi:hypothetical protein